LEQARLPSAISLNGDQCYSGHGEKYSLNELLGDRKGCLRIICTIAVLLIMMVVLLIVVLQQRKDQIEATPHSGAISFSKEGYISPDIANGSKLAVYKNNLIVAGRGLGIIPVNDNTVRIRFELKSNLVDLSLGYNGSIFYSLIRDKDLIDVYKVYVENTLPSIKLKAAKTINGVLAYDSTTDMILIGNKTAGVYYGKNITDSLTLNSTIPLQISAPPYKMIAFENTLTYIEESTMVLKYVNVSEPSIFHDITLIDGDKTVSPLRATTIARGFSDTFYLVNRENSRILVLKPHVERFVLKVLREIEILANISSIAVDEPEFYLYFTQHENNSIHRINL
jgi:hypothetical protein